MLHVHIPNYICPCPIVSLNSTVHPPRRLSSVVRSPDTLVSTVIVVILICPRQIRMLLSRGGTPLCLGNKLQLRLRVSTPVTRCVFMCREFPGVHRLSSQPSRPSAPFPSRRSRFRASVSVITVVHGTQYHDAHPPHPRLPHTPLSYTLELRNIVR